MSHLHGERMPVSPGEVREFIRQPKDTGRANGRVADKLMLALTRKLVPEQRAGLVRDYARRSPARRCPD